ENVAQTLLTVHPDPRLNHTAGMYDVRERMQTELDTTIVQATRAWNKLREARKGIKLAKSLLVHADKTMKDSLNKQAKELVGIIDSLEEIMMEPADLKGIQRNPTNLRAKLFQASSYIRQIQGPTSQMASVSLQQFQLGATEFIDAVNTFISEDLQAFRAQLTDLEMPLFDESIRE
ncbi:MAG: hypothetical protein AAFY76_22145, partial [Cyanobacteria bacterium J06649_11]